MAAELVMWENLESMLARTEVALLSPLQEPEGLVDLLRKARGLAVALEGRNHIHRTRVTKPAMQDHSDNISDIVMNDLLKEFSILLYKADDLVDEILTFDQRTKLRRDRMENHIPLVPQVIHDMARSISEVSGFLSAANKFNYSKVMARRVENIRKDMKKLVERLVDEPGNSDQPDQRDFQPVGLVKVEPAHDILMGRRKDLRKIVQKLIQPHTNGEPNASVICMIGSPGIGKSALAKDIYADQKIKSHFDLRMWISVSEITEEKEIIRGIVNSCTNTFNRQISKACQIDQNYTSPFQDLLGCQSTSTSKTSIINVTSHCKIDKYERRLKQEIGGKLYLLVLDNVCLEEWQYLKGLLAEGAPGSRILMTTRSHEVAEVVKREFGDSKRYQLKSPPTMILMTTQSDKVAEVGEKVSSGFEPYQLKGPPERHCWLLFKRQASVEDGFWDKELKDAGAEIVNICQFAPLTIKVAARFLQGKNKEKWLTFTRGLQLMRERREDIIKHMIHHTFSDLSPQLRACFVYCSLFPNDFTFNKSDLISLWIAQGFVKALDGMSLEHVGEMYFMELSRRWLFEDVRTDDLGNILTCKMHHIVHSFATEFTVGISNLHLTDSGQIQIKDPTTKHVLVNCRSGLSLNLRPHIPNGPSLRTLIFVKEPDCDIKMDSLVFTRLISMYKGLRVLDLHDLEVNELPDSIGDQIHLRYLDISNNYGLITLPKSFSRLYNLQTLKLNSCPKLKRLDIYFGLLANLIRFEVDDCERLTCMPPGLEKLTQLETMSRFVVGERPSKETAPVGLHALSRLNMLRGRLAIHFTGDWKTNTPEASQALYTKKDLVEVKISWAQRTSDNEVPRHEEISAHEVALEALKPNEALESLCIEGYKGGDFPSWANRHITSYLPNLVIISIEGCGDCQYLPPFSELKHLEKLTLRNMTNVRFIEDTALPDVQVRGNQEIMEERTFFESLKELALLNFYNLEGWQQEVASIQQETQSFPCLSVLKIWNSPKLISFPSFIGVSDIDLRNVNHLVFTECSKSETMPKSKLCTSNLQIKGCLGLNDFGLVRKGFQGLPSLKELMLNSCDELTSLASEITQLTSLERLEISNCKLLDFPKDSEAQTTVLQEGDDSWLNLKSLNHLKLKELPKMKTLPDCLQHVKSLKTLWISACPSLESLPEWISCLTELRHLRIESCRALKSLPKGLKEVKSLMKVEITECPDLMQRCQKHTGEDWLKIKHARILLHKSRRYRHV